jgi:hypothetical protein
MIHHEHGTMDHTVAPGNLLAVEVQVTQLSAIMLLPMPQRRGDLMQRDVHVIINRQSVGQVCVAAEA